MKKKKIKILIAVVILIAVSLGVSLPIMASKGLLSKGNGEEYSVQNSSSDISYPNLKGKRIIFLGSSVTYGSASKGESFVEYMEKLDGIIPVKEAVSGTTLVDRNEKSYIERLKRLDKTMQADLLVCQLSTNDATKKLPLGEIGSSFDINDFDTGTVAGAIEYVIAYSKETWNCPVVFFTGTKYDSEQYGKMVDLLLQIQKKWDIGVIDLWNSDINSISKKDYKLYMANGIHPTRAGYRDWWTPEFRKYLSDYLK